MTTQPPPLDRDFAYQIMIEVLEPMFMEEDITPDELIEVLLEIYGDIVTVKQALNYYIDVTNSALYYLEDKFKE